MEEEEEEENEVKTGSRIHNLTAYVYIPDFNFVTFSHQIGSTNVCYVRLCCFSTELLWNCKSALPTDKTPHLSQRNFFSDIQSNLPTDPDDGRNVNDNDSPVTLVFAHLSFSPGSLLLTWRRLMVSSASFAHHTESRVCARSTLIKLSRTSTSWYGIFLWTSCRFSSRKAPCRKIKQTTVSWSLHKSEDVGFSLFRFAKSQWSRNLSVAVIGQSWSLFSFTVNFSVFVILLGPICW